MPPMTTGGTEAKRTVCFSCESGPLRTRFDDVRGVISGRYRIVQCDECDIAFIQTREAERVDYSDYGDHLATQSDDYFAARVSHMSAAKRVLFRYLMRRFGADANVLDFGGGAGFFVRSCLTFGFRHVYLVEPSFKLRAVAENRLGLDASNTSEDIAAFDAQFDVVAMLDVIEHLPVELFGEIMTGIVRKMRPGAILLGTTPNLNSLNIKLFKQKDPVIAPPLHRLYFTSASLDSYLRKLGLRKKMLFVTGLSTNSFFRTEKFSPSWVERPRGWRKPVALAVRVLFAGAGALLTLSDAGYGIYFVYEKTNAPVTDS